MSLLSFELPSLETIELEPDGETLRAWLNRPESRNAHNQLMIREVCEGDDELDAAVDRWVARLIDLPSLSVQMAKHQLRGYAQITRLGDLSEFDGDASARSIVSEDAQARFGTF